MSVEFEEDSDLLKFLSSLDKEQAISKGDAKWVVIWNSPTVALMSKLSEANQRIVDLAHSDEAVLLTPDKVGSVESQLEKLVDLAYLTREAQGIYRIELKLVKRMVGLTSKNP